ncbi:MAG: twin-arginine translocase TatA/TatE family subunit, partial [Actinomycetaceae bacterium]
MTMFRNGLQPTHIIVLVVVILLVFGFSRLPDIASSIGKAMKVFKKEVKELREDDDAPTTPGSPGTGQDSTSQPPSSGGGAAGGGTSAGDADPSARRSEST